MARKTLVPIDHGGQLAQNAADPVGAQDLATKAYVDSRVFRAAATGEADTPEVTTVSNLHTVSIAAGDLAAGSRLQITAVIGSTGNAGVRTHQLTIAGVIVVSHVLTNPTAAFELVIDGFVYVVSSTLAPYRFVTYDRTDGSTRQTDGGTLTADLTAAQSIRTRGQTSNVADEVISHGLTVAELAP